MKLIRITTVPVSLQTLLRDQLGFMRKNGYEPIGISSPGKTLDEVGESQKVRVIPVEMTRKITPLKDIQALYKLVKIFRKEKPEVVHTHTPKAGLLGMMAAKIARVPHRLHTVAGLPLLVATGMKRKTLNFTEKTTYSCATMVYPNSLGLKEVILENGFTSEKKLKVIGNGSSNGVDTHTFDPTQIDPQKIQALRAELNIAVDDFVFLFVGRVVKDKGIEELVQAFTNISPKNEKAHLIVVGPYESDLDPIASQTKETIDRNPQIHAVGRKSNVVDYYGLANVLTFPSYREGFPNVVMEAASMQLNCIVTDINGCNEIITHKENGWIVPVKNVSQLEKHMTWCLEHPEDSKVMGEKSRQIMQQKYERSFVQKSLLKEYNRILKTP